MVLGVPGWSCMLFSFCPARSERAPASSPCLSCDRPANPKSCILLSTSLSASRSIACFSAAAFLLFVVEIMPLSPENSASTSSGWSPLCHRVASPAALFFHLACRSPGALVLCCLVSHLLFFRLLFLRCFGSLVLLDLLRFFQLRPQLRIFQPLCISLLRR